MILSAVNSTIIEEIKKETGPIYSEVMKIKEMLAKDPWLMIPEPLRPYIGILVFIALVMAIVASILAVVMAGRRPKAEAVREGGGSVSVEKLAQTLAYWNQKDLENLRRDVENLKRRGAE
jgi:hypothetical protein